MANGIQRIERRVKLHDLRVLMSVVERGSMAKAAESLATSQPAISRSNRRPRIFLGRASS
jgi:DNA-binding transcriptional LysR family regulator